MCFVWLSTSFNNYLLLFLTASFTEEYKIGISFGIADLLSYAVSGLLYKFLGARWSLVIAFGIATWGGLIVCAYGLSHQDSWLFVALIFFCRIGISFSFNLIYVAHAPIFPVLFASVNSQLYNQNTKTIFYLRGII